MCQNWRYKIVYEILERLNINAALASVCRSSSTIEMPLIAAMKFATIQTLLGTLGLPRFGLGLKKGLSVSNKSR